MNSPSTPYITSRNMEIYDTSRNIGIYEPMHQMNMWADIKSNGFLNTSTSMLVEVDTKLDNQSEDTSHETLGHSGKYDQETNKPVDKVLRRLAQNREAARKSRLRKKAYVQQLESSRLKLLQLEQELERTRQQGALTGGGLDAIPSGFSGPLNPGICAFDLAYGSWVEEHDRLVENLKTAIYTYTDEELCILVNVVMNHYSDLFRMKATSAKADVFYLMSGMWKTSAERLFLWIGGFRPSELLKVMLPHLDLLDKQHAEVCNLKQSCQQTEDALSQGMEKLQQTLSDALAAGQLGEGSYFPQITNAMERLDALVSFVNQADHIRQVTLQQMSRILDTRQTAQAFLVLGEYFQRLRALSLLWDNRSCEPTS
ncbi:hypothetical protein DCAR_0100965 [Daucus carota subsp. sativus]|uniref:DOG1 domain-containing protein n=2 Tax=Daucus carota subsp. sativus TaxID=79200 RepID=A0AAF0W266_DAUCS|nr:hypothetical protein DCAR_0100965 [Daucus carota subsp. sativus]